VAILIDCSGSTSDYVDRLMAFAGCMAEGARDAGADVAAWAYGSQYQPVPCRILHCVTPPILGGTIMSGPLEEAYGWLADHADLYKRKVCVMLTDGEPDPHDKPLIKKQAEYAARHNILTVVGCI